MGMGSPEILKLVENCPKSAETLVTRIISILTEQSNRTCLPKTQVFEVLRLAPPSRELVEKVRDLYHKRVSDVRFLIPVLTGLDKVCLLFALKTKEHSKSSREKLSMPYLN